MTGPLPHDATPPQPDPQDAELQAVDRAADAWSLGLMWMAEFGMTPAAGERQLLATYGLSAEVLAELSALARRVAAHAQPPGVIDTAQVVAEAAWRLWLLRVGLRPGVMWTPAGTSAWMTAIVDAGMCLVHGPATSPRVTVAVDGSDTTWWRNLVRDHGVDEQAAVAAWAAGLSPKEALGLHTGGGLDVADLQQMAAMRRIVPRT